MEKQIVELIGIVTSKTSSNLGPNYAGWPIKYYFDFQPQKLRIKIAEEKLPRNLDYGEASFIMDYKNYKVKLTGYMEDKLFIALKFEVVESPQLVTYSEKSFIKQFSKYQSTLSNFKTFKPLTLSPNLLPSH